MSPMQNLTVGGSGTALRQYKKEKLTSEIDPRNQNPVYNEPRNTQTYQNPLFNVSSKKINDKEKEKLEKEENEVKAKEVASISAAMIFKNKAIWWFLAIVLAIGIFFAIVFTVPSCHHLMSDSIDGADGCVNNVQAINNCLQSKSCKY